MIYNILNYGAIPGENHVNTAAIQNAIDKCSANGGGTVLIPSGLFISGTLYLKSNVDLHFEMGAVRRRHRAVSGGAGDVFPALHPLGRHPLCLSPAGAHPRPL